MEVTAYFLLTSSGSLHLPFQAVQGGEAADIILTLFVTAMVVYAKAVADAGRRHVYRRRRR